MISRFGVDCSAAASSGVDVLRALGVVGRGLDVQPDDLLRARDGLERLIDLILDQRTDVFCTVVRAELEHDDGSAMFGDEPGKVGDPLLDRSAAIGHDHGGPTVLLELSAYFVDRLIQDGVTDDEDLGRLDGRAAGRDGAHHDDEYQCHREACTQSRRAEPTREMHARSYPHELPPMRHRARYGLRRVSRQLRRRRRCGRSLR